MMRNIRLILLTTAVAATFVAVRHHYTVHAAAVQAPMFEIDPYFPKPLPNHWVLGSTIGVSTDSNDHVWIIHRPQTVEANFKAADLKLGNCCKVAPPVLEFDQAGNLVNSWGGPGQGYDWPDSNHGITVDHKGNVWLAGNGQKDTQVLKFDGKGKFLLQIGHHGVHHGSNDTENFWEPTKITEDAAANEVYISDGYGNRRVIVFDAETGKYKRHWGAYGEKPTDDKEQPYDPAALEDEPGKPHTGAPSRNFSTPHCVMIAKDGLVYVCDRVNDRIQVFQKDGKFLKEVFIDPKTLRSGAVWDIEFSRDPQQTYMYVANGVDEKINILDRKSMTVLTSFGDGGRGPGQFFGCHNLATDSKGNLYVTETYTGARLQRFLYKGVGPVDSAQHVAWPKGKL